MKSFYEYKKFCLVFLAGLLFFSLTGCIGAGSGYIIGAPTVIGSKLTTAQIDATTAATGLQPLTGTAKCDVTVVQINYQTSGVQQGEMTNASAAVLVPSGVDCPGPFPLIAYGRGTTPFKTHTMANPEDPETIRLMAFFAAQGYVVVATDYLSYALSSYPYHPYMHADTEASSIIDSIRATRNAALSLGSTLNGKVMLSGYSQGGHASMATQRAIEQSDAGEIILAAAAHIAGVYSISGALIDGVKNPILGVQALVPFEITSWQRIFGNVYDKVADVFNSPYDRYIETLFPTLLDQAALYNLLPGGTPAQARDAMFKSSYLNDLTNNTSNGAILAAKKQDLLSWNPKAPTILCGGLHDPTVKFPINAQATYDAFRSRGGSNVSLVDVDARIQQTYQSVYINDFQTYNNSYHVQYEPLFCTQVAKEMFDQYK
jgi:pimeloyl-ACP methyl ester carboxylesterase